MRAAKAVAIAAVLVLLVGPAAAQFGMSGATTERGQVIESRYNQIALAGFLMFLLVMVILVIVLVRFREGSGKGRATHEKERHSTAAEVGWLVGPLILVLWIGIISYNGLVTLDAPAGDTGAHEIQVQASQYAWRFDYSRMPGGTGPGGEPVQVSVVTTNNAHGNYSYSDTFHIPSGVPVRFNMTSSDVIHAFQIFDGHRAAFSFNDVNPAGDHKFTQATWNFPPGDYFVQCNKFCGNPGHAGMLAKITAEPQTQYELWLKHRSELTNASIAAEVAVTPTETGFTVNGQAPANQTYVVGERLVVEVNNPLSHDAIFTVNGETHTVPALTHTFFHANFGVAGSFALRSGATSMGIEVVQATAVQVTLSDFHIEPQDLQLKVGTQYLIQVHNAGSTLHNYYVGTYPNAVIHSDNVNAGTTSAFLFQPTSAGALDTWCNVSGHYGLGMHAKTTIVA